MKPTSGIKFSFGSSAKPSEPRSASDSSEKAAVVGERGAKYGLLLPSTSNTASKGPAASSSAPLSARPASGLFEDDEDDDTMNQGDDSDKFASIRRVNAQLAKQSGKYRIDQKHVEALMQDSTVFEYDAVYDELQAKRASAAQSAQTSKAAEMEEGKPKYLDSLKQTAELRKREREVTLEKLKLREQMREDEVYGEKERIVTSAYKQKLLEDQIWMEKLAEQDEKDEVAMKKGIDMTTFRKLSQRGTAAGATSVNAAALVAEATEAALAQAREEEEEQRRRRREQKEKERAERITTSKAGEVSTSTTTNDDGKSDVLSTLAEETKAADNASASASSQTAASASAAKLPPPVPAPVHVAPPQLTFTSSFPSTVAASILAVPKLLPEERPERVRLARERYLLRKEAKMKMKEKQPTCTTASGTGNAS